MLRTWLTIIAWMALVYFVYVTGPQLGTVRAAYWLMMQIASAVGLATRYPVSVWLVRHGDQAMEPPTIPTAAGAVASRVVIGEDRAGDPQPGQLSKSHG